MSNEVQHGSEASYSKATEEQWNHPRSNILKTLATFWSFLVMGANDSAYGVSSQCNSLLKVHTDETPQPLLPYVRYQDSSCIFHF